MAKIKVEKLKKAYKKTGDLEKAVELYNSGLPSEEQITLKRAKLFFQKIGEAEAKKNISPVLGITPTGWVYAIGVFYTLTSLMHMQFLVVEKQKYWDFYHYMPAWLILLRYSFSWFQRIVGISSGVGIMFFKDIYRKILMAICIFTIAGLYWKHPYTAFSVHARQLDQAYPNLLKNVPGVTFESLTLASLVFYYIIEVLFNGYIVYFFTRPNIKKLFRK